MEPFAEDQNPRMQEETSALDGIAIIGMAGRFPGAQDLDAFWRNLVAGTDSVTRFSPEQLEASNLSARELGGDYVAARGVLDDAAMFDAEYFGISPREAERMDPQHRLFLEACSNALEDGGYGRPDYAGEIGLFAGCSLNTYLLANLMADRAALEELAGSYQVGEFQVALGNDKDFLTTRVAYKLNLRGPCVSVQSACATSLVAICQASQALLNYQCDMALAGGVSVTFPQHRGHVYSEGGIVSKDGHCRPFDAEATGTVFGHGVGAVLLKRVEDALRDGDHIAAIIRGFAVNNDGSAKAGYMAPGVDGQSRVIRAAHAMAGINPETITYVEAHGTGTPLGDPIEIAALTEAFRAGTDKAAFCAVGTAKGNVGHLDSAAGVTGTIKAVLSLQNRMLPGLAHFQTANPNIDLEGSPFFFEGLTKAWTSRYPLRAGVSAFGVGGVNAHIVLEEAPAQQSGPTPRERQVLCVSGRTEAAARQAAGNLATFLGKNPATSLADAAFTLACGRQAHEYRIAVAASTTAEAGDLLKAAAPVRSRSRETAWLFPGQGTQFPGMGKALYDSEPVYRAVVDECAAVLMPLLGLDLRGLLFGDAEAAAELEQTAIAQPAIFVTELALATLWQSWGLTPSAMLGHSLGEYVAATLAGVFSRNDALNLVCTRARLMQSLPAGAMLSVAAGEAVVSGYVRDGISVAALNSPRASVLSGTLAAIDAVALELKQAGIATRRLHTSHAFHSEMMEPMLKPFGEAVGRIRLKPPTERFVSSVTGSWITAAEATDPAYWVEQCRRPVRFGEALACLLENNVTTLLEVGPGDVLTRLSLQQAPGRDGLAAIPSLVAARGEVAAVSVPEALARLWSTGCAPDWSGFYANEQRLRVSLPTYPFERKLHWVAPPARADRMTQQPASTTATLAAPKEIPAMTNPSPSSSEEPRSVRIRARICEVLRELSGIDIRPEEAEVSFLELGFDSLFLTQATQSLSKAFATKLTFRQLMEQFSSVAGLAAHLDATLPASAFAAPVVAAAAPAVSMAAVPPSSQQPIDRLLADQLATLSRLFAEQVATLQSVAGLAPAASLPASAPAKPAAPVPVASGNDSGEVRFSSHRATQKTTQELTPAQQRYIDALIARYEQKTPESKRLTASGRPILADPRAVAGFRPQWKEMVYPLVVDRARGSRLWDVDGNEYIDIVNGYGCIMFGHSPEFVVEAARDQLERGVAIGPQTPLAAEVAEMICELTGNDRVTFCNTGSEAVMAAIRVARTVTGRDKIVYFTGDYHGTFDEVLIRNTPRGSAPLAPGIPLANVTNVAVLDYGAEASLDYIRANADDIAAVIIEPVQTRHPENQPVEFMRQVRTLTEQTGSAMIIDEVVTGFRLAPGGAQEHFGIRADMCTYGKVIGGGHPIGVLSGKREYLDALDGGAWQYGDSSSPEVGVTFFAGTFVRHPLAMAAARAVLRHLRAAGPSLQRDLNAKTAKLAESIDRFFVERGVPSRIHHFASWFYFTFPNDARLGSLLYYSMRAKGIHIQEGYPCFLTTAHTDEDIAAIEAAFREAVVEMQEAGVLPSAPGLAPPDPTDHEPKRVPLTEPQREIFLAAHLSDEANCAFNESLTLELRGPIREAELIVAMEMVQARHDALRSTVSEDGDWLVVGNEFKSRTDIRDLTGLGADEQQRVLAETIAQEAATPFDLVAGPLIRSTCFRLSPDHAVLVMTAHHIVLDGWSANVLLEEVGKVYSKGAAAQSELSTLMPFSQYAIEERRREEEGAFADNEAYWIKTFTGRQPRLDLPTDRPRPAEKSYAGGTFHGRLGSELYAELKKASAKAGCSLYVTLLAGFEMLMHRLTGQDEVVVGISTAGQALVEDASLIGHCVHFLPMLSELAQGEIVKDHLRKTRTALLDAYDHQEFTYGSLLRKLKLEREPGRLPLIEVQFNLERVGTNVVFDGLDVSMRANAKRFVNTDLFLNVVETANDLEFACDFNSALFDESTIDRWMQCWAQLLGAQAQSPETRIDELPLFNAAERQRVLYDWNRTAQDFGAFTPLITTFLNDAQATPDRVALECNGVAWTCSRLAGFARGLAARLVEEGLEPGGLVAIAVKRSPEMVGAMLAVMMAGGAYVPLDPRHPQERLEAVLKDSGVTIVVTNVELSLKTAAKMLDLTALPVKPNSTFVPRAIAANSLAYVIYTSGSTGVPKGVAIEHGALMNLLHSMRREPGLTTDDTWVAITTLAFDIAALELLLPLLTGARLVIANEEEVVDGVMLLALLERVHATVLQATPGAWRILLDAGWTGRQPLKALCGGEALPRDLAETLVDHASELWNVYGPTETTIWSSATRVTHGSGPLPIGPPIANTQFYVLDARLQPVAVGCTGELFIGGDGLARGYWNRPELTAEKFIANPFGAGRIYATGDLARFRPDGLIELLGRADFQVKIRGYRIELAEIETALCRHPQVRESVVVQQKPDGVANARLVAYVATGYSSDDPRAAQLLRELPAALAAALPDYMMPSLVIVLDKLPRTPNGKIDRKGLPPTGVSLSLERKGDAKPFTPPATATEKLLAGIWCEVLQIEAVSIYASIFELGADSLLIFRIAAKAQRAGLALKATTIFQQRTIAAVAAALDTVTTAAPVAERVPARIVPASRDRYKLPRVKADA
jgi:amino acid adenylation domain-containing protein